MVAVPDAALLQKVALVLAFVLSLLVVWALDRPRGRWGRALRSRFLMGVPWGTLTVTVGVLGFYLVVQGGLENWYSPVTLPFRAWSYFYPVGILTAGFAHSGAGHLVGNLVGTLTLAPIAEYAFGHFPRERGSSSFGSALSNPFVRAFLVVPGAVLVVGVVTTVFAIGPVIGFSAVVFAFAGFALVRYPYATVLALTVGRLLTISYYSLNSPTVVGESQPVFSTPWWAEIAIQGHALGLFVGVLLGVWYLRSRADERPTALRTWTGVLLFGVSQSLWAVYWFRGAETFVLFRAVGMALVAVLATLVAVSVAGRTRPLRAGVGDDSMFALEHWQVGLVLLTLGVAALSGPAVPYNVVTAGDEGLPGQSVDVRGYEVTYAEGVPNGLTAAFDVEAFGETTSVNASGVIVRNEDRSIWTTAVTRGRLAFDGRSAVRVGGIGWRETVYAHRVGWQTVDGNATYRVSIAHRDRNVTVFTAPPARAEPVIAGRNVSLVATNETFLVAVSRGNQTLAGPVPARNESVTVDGVRFVRSDRRVIAVWNGTRVPIASQQVPLSQQRRT